MNGLYRDTASGSLRVVKRMQQQLVKQVSSSASRPVALEALAKSMARWTDKGDQLVTAIPGLSLHRRNEPTQPLPI